MVTSSDCRAASTRFTSRFLPLLIVWPVWYWFARNSFPQIFQWWPATVAMICGSFVAGSTPLGGGVVAFPVGALVLKFTGSESRDISVLIQSVGMNAAAYVLILYKRHLLDRTFIAFYIIGGTIGMAVAIGEIFNLPDSWINLAYTVIVFEFGIFYAYRNLTLQETTVNQDEVVDVVDINNVNVRDSLDTSTLDAEEMENDIDLTFQCHSTATMFAMGVSAVIGGFMVGSVGTGSDIFLYIYGLLVWNVVHPHAALGDNVLTASSIVVMGVNSFIAVILRLVISPLLKHQHGGTNTTTTSTFSPRVLETFAAMVPVVVVGAPLGSMILTPERLPYLRCMFYFLALFQLTMFGVLKIKGAWQSWLVIIFLTLIQLVALLVHHRRQR